MKNENVKEWSLGLGMALLYMRMLFCVSNAPGMVVKYRNHIFHIYLDKFAVVFIEDILIYYKLRGKTYRVLDN